ncbi:VanZ family protein [Pseudochrobactrum sp. MP213Fo]|uniref:VanZ family protein n=1 Tax=Pseudochrobactrum sp. MP213Fo TaxID=3022250 RepID=UPI003BA2030F
MRHFSLLPVLAWLMLAALLVVTVSPIGLRPHIPGHVTTERFLALATIGLLFCLAYPKRWLFVLIMLIAVAGLFELMQRLTPDRHGELSDFIVKSCGAITGVFVGKLILYWKKSLN